MISERQARALLDDCEERMGIPLAELRRRLQRDDPCPDLWELVVLDAVLAALPSVEHEPHPGAPDIVIGRPGESQMFIECAWITPPQGENQERLYRFIDWVRQQTIEHLPGTHLNLRLEAINRDAAVVPPLEHEWKSVTQTPDWEGFIEAVGSGDRPTLALDGDRNFKVIVEGRARGSIVSTSGLIFNTPEHPEDHPIYRAIRTKARQANQRHHQGGAYEPLVLVIGADEGLAYIDPIGCGAVTLKQAVYSALLHDDAHPITRYNNAGSWPPRKPRKRSGPVHTFNMCGPRVRVNRSYLISAVAVALFRDQISYPGAQHRRLADVTVFPNPDPRASFTDDHVHRLEQYLKLNRVEYVSRRECWEYDPQPNAALPASRARLRGGQVVTRGGGLTMPDEIEIPAVLMHRILAGDLDTSDAWKHYSTNVSAQFKQALDNGREIEHVEYVATEPRSREEPRVRIRFGPPQPPLIRVDRSHRET
ncbi:MAG: hypothetical protein ACR2GY_01670 [Phycisphaerales bacterium]